MRPALFAAALLLLPVAGLRAQDKLKETPYFPLKVGTEWEYKGSGQKYVVRVTKHEKVDTTLCAVVETTADNTTIVEYYTVTDDGVVRLTWNNAKADPPVLVLKLPPRKGESWKVQSKVGNLTIKATYTEGEESVEVPFAKYTNAVTVSSSDCEVEDKKFGVTTWYASGVGMVKQVIDVGGTKVTLELVKFKAGS